MGVFSSPILIGIFGFDIGQIIICSTLAQLPWMRLCVNIKSRNLLFLIRFPPPLRLKNGMAKVHGSFLPIEKTLRVALSYVLSHK